MCAAQERIKRRIDVCSRCRHARTPMPTERGDDLVQGCYKGVKRVLPGPQIRRLRTKRVSGSTSSAKGRTLHVKVLCTEHAAMLASNEMVHKRHVTHHAQIEKHAPSSYDKSARCNTDMERQQTRRACAYPKCARINAHCERAFSEMSSAFLVSS
jgi:hypothetical protein